MRRDDIFGEFWSGLSLGSSSFRRWLPSRTTLSATENEMHALTRLWALLSARRRTQADDGKGPAISLVAVVGLQFEAAIVSGPGVGTVLVSPRSETASFGRTQSHCGVLSFGVCGGLRPNLVTGDCIVASSVVSEAGSWRTDDDWSERLREIAPEAIYAPILGVDSPLAEIEDKRRAFARSKAAAVDMESHVAASVASAHGLRFAAVRVVFDDARCRIVPAALAGRRIDGSVDSAAVLRELWRSPRQLAPLLRLAALTYSARAQLLRLRQNLGEDFALPEGAGFVASAPAIEEPEERGVLGERVGPRQDRAHPAR